MTEKELKNKDLKKFTHYHCTELIDSKAIYIKLLNDNLLQLLEYIYEHQNTAPYNTPEIRVALAMQLIISSRKQIPFQLTSRIAKDLEDLRKDDNYTNQWAVPSLKRKALSKELDILKTHTQIDETMSLNQSHPNDDPTKQEFTDFDIHSGMSTLNVSSYCPIGESNESDNSCVLM